MRQFVDLLVCSHLVRDLSCDELLQVRGPYVLRSDTLVIVQVQSGGHVPDHFSVLVRDTSVAPLLSFYNVGKYKKANWFVI